MVLWEMGTNTSVGKATTPFFAYKVTNQPKFGNRKAEASFRQPLLTRLRGGKILSGQMVNSTRTIALQNKYLIRNKT